MFTSMKMAFRMFRRKGVYYWQNNQTGQQKSFGTRDKGEAQRELNAKNEAAKNPAAVNVRIAKTYVAAGRPDLLTRTWHGVFKAMTPSKNGPTKERWLRAGQDAAYERIWNVTLFETEPKLLLDTMDAGSVATNVFLRRMHNFAIDMDWLMCPILPKKKWPKIKHKETRATTFVEHALILAGEDNQERQDYYDLCWYTGGSQGDIASLCAENVDWEKGTVHYKRKKTAVDVMQGMGKKVKAILERLPKSGPLFPNMIKMRASDRATEFKRACRRVGVSGITLHSYRYAWAERAAENGFEERYAQAALGHNSKAVARAYARKAKTTIPSLEDYEEKNARSKN